MPDKPHRNVLRVTAELIRQYVQDTLDDRTMHALERQALEDPLLAEALEGYGRHDPDQSAQLEELQRRLEQRVADNPARPGKIPLRRRLVLWGAAASLLLLLGLGALLRWRFTSPPAPPVARERPAAPQRVPPAVSPPPAGDSIAADLAFERSQPVPVPVPATAQPQPRPQTHAVTPSRPSAAPTSGALPVIARSPLPQPDSIDAGLAVISQKPAAAPAEAGIALAGRAAGVAVSGDRKAAKRSRRAEAPGDADSMQVEGQVTSTEGTPLSGVTVWVSGEKAGAITDTQGRFTITMPARPDTLQLAYVGFDSRTVPVDPGRNRLAVQLRPASSALQEAVVVGYGARKSEQTSSVTGAYPLGGYPAFEKYLRDSLRYPAEARQQRLQGRVVLSFTVMPDSSLRKIRVRKGLGGGCDEEALRLLREGPAWVPGSDGRSERKRIAVPFRLPAR